MGSEIVLIKPVWGVDIFLAANLVIRYFCLIFNGRQWASHIILSIGLDLKAPMAILMPVFCTVLSVLRVFWLVRL